MQVRIAISLGADELEKRVTVIDSAGNKTELHAEAGQVHLDANDGDTITVGKPEEKPAE